jgi:6-phosphogluconolactonase (cycloisomerase 2 family)
MQFFFRDKPLSHKGRAALAAGAAATALAVVGAPAVAGAATQHPAASIGNAVFVQSNGTDGNQILAYSRAADGTLSFAHAYDTGGLGARETGSVVDPLASQGSLAYDATADLLIAVNAGSNTITTFHVNGDTLGHATVYRAGNLPTSVTSWHRYVYVLDAGGTGAVRGFVSDGGHLTAVRGSERGLGLNGSATPQFLNTPGQIGVTPDGSHLVVTTKANGSTIDLFAIHEGGSLSAHFVANPSVAPVPFSFVFDPHGRIVDTEAGTSSVSTYGVDSDGSLTNASDVPDGQKAACWIAEAGGYYFVVNAGSADIASYQVSTGGVASLVTATAGTTDPGPIDAAASSGGSYLYVESGGAGSVDEFAVNSNGTLTSIGSVTGLSGTGIEGIVAA